MKFSTTDERTPPPEVLEARTPHATVRYPDGFVASEYDGAELVLTLREEQPGFQPNLVLTAVESTAPLTDASAAALFAAGRQHPGARVLGVDLWDEDPDAALARARHITFVYPAATTDVVVTKTVWATGTHHVHLSASAPPAQLGMLRPVFSWIAAQLRLTADPAEVEAAARAVGAAPVDAEASRRVGFPLEDLAAFAPPAFVVTAPVVSAAALRELRAGAARIRGGSASLPRRVRGTDAAAELAEAGFVDDASRLTPAGTAVAYALGSPRPVLVVRARRGGVAAVLVAFAGPRGIVVSHDPSVAELHAGTATADPERRHHALIVPEHLPAFVAAWIGLSPFWPIDDPEAPAVTTAALEDAVRADAAPWTDVLVQGSGMERYDVIVPGRGWKRVTPPADDAHGLIVDPSLAVYAFLVEVGARALGR